MENFNMKRFALTSKWAFKDTQKEMTSITVMMFLVYMLQFLIWMWPMIKGSQHLSDMRLTGSVKTCSIFYLFFIAISGCWIFSNMKTKEQRITFKMLPASDLEKFAVRFLYVTVAWGVIGFAAFCLADFLRIAICLISGFDWVTCTIPDFVTVWSAGHEASGSASANAVPPMSLQLAATALAVWGHSMYILGGAFFRRRQFVLTSCVHFIIGMLFITVSVTDNGFMSNIRSEEQISLMLYAAAVLLTVLGVVNWWLSYKIFKRMQVINNKWINV